MSTQRVSTLLYKSTVLRFQEMYEVSSIIFAWCPGSIMSESISSWTFYSWEITFLLLKVLYHLCYFHICISSQQICCFKNKLFLLALKHCFAQSLYVHQTFLGGGGWNSTKDCIFLARVCFPPWVSASSFSLQSELLLAQSRERVGRQWKREGRYFLAIWSKMFLQVNKIQIQSHVCLSI